MYEENHRDNSKTQEHRITHKKKKKLWTIKGKKKQKKTLKHNTATKILPFIQMSERRFSIVSLVPQPES